MNYFRMIFTLSLLVDTSYAQSFQSRIVEHTQPDRQHTVSEMGISFDKEGNASWSTGHSVMTVPPHNFSETTIFEENLEERTFSILVEPKSVDRKYLGTVYNSGGMTPNELWGTSVLRSFAVFENGKGELEIWPLNGLQAFRIDPAKVAPADLEAFRADLIANVNDPTKAKYKMNSEGSIVDSESGRTIIAADRGMASHLLSGHAISIFTPTGDLPSYNQAVPIEMSIQELMAHLETVYGKDARLSVDLEFPGGQNEFLIRALQPKKASDNSDTAQLREIP